MKNWLGRSHKKSSACDSRITVDEGIDWLRAADELDGAGGSKGVEDALDTDAVGFSDRAWIALSSEASSVDGVFLEDPFPFPLGGGLATSGECDTLAKRRKTHCQMNSVRSESRIVSALVYISARTLRGICTSQKRASWPIGPSSHEFVKLIHIPLEIAPNEGRFALHLTRAKL